MKKGILFAAIGFIIFVVEIISIAIINYNGVDYCIRESWFSIFATGFVILGIVGGISFMVSILLN